MPVGTFSSGRQADPVMFAGGIPVVGGGGRVAPHAGLGRRPTRSLYGGGGGGGGGAGPAFSGAGPAGATGLFAKLQQQAAANRGARSRPSVSGGGGGGGGGDDLVSTTQASPHLMGAQRSYEARLKELRRREDEDDPLLQEQVERLRERLGEDDTERRTGRAFGRIADAASADREGALEGLSESGRGGGGIGERDLAETEDREARAKASAAADIELAQQQRLDSLTLGGQGIMEAPGARRLARERDVTDFTTKGLDYAMAPEELDLAKKRLGLDQWRAKTGADIDRERLGFEREAAGRQRSAFPYQLLQTAYEGFY